MGAALGWGTFAASSLVLGALLGIAREWPPRLVGLVLAFGAGALISAVSFELAEEGVHIGGAAAVAIGLALGALFYFVCDVGLDRLSAGKEAHRSNAGSADAGPALALGAVLDGIPEQLVLGLGVAIGDGVSAGLLAAIFVSNLPEAIGASDGMHRTGRSRQTILRLWLAVAVILTLATVAGYGIERVGQAVDGVGGRERRPCQGCKRGQQCKRRQ